MHIYKEGGFFLSHRDTLHDKAHMATLVVCLPMNHTGGELVVRNDGQSHTFTFGKKTQSLQWGAFYTDCLHEVKPVTSGVRVGLQFDLFVNGQKNKKDFGEAEPITTNSRWFGLGPAKIEIPRKDVDKTSFVAALTQYFDKYPKKRLGILLNHRYAMASLESQYLKGIDRTLYDIGTEQKWTVQLKSVLLNGSSYDDYHDGDTFSAHPFDLEDILRVTQARSTRKRLKSEESESESESEASKDSESEEAQTSSQIHEYEETIILVPGPNSYLKCLSHTNYIEHTGNESAPETNSYFSGVMLISP
jgi:hypothetical protein